MRGVSVVFDTHHDEHHCRFVLWVRTMAQRQNSLKLVTNLVARTRWQPEYTLPVRATLSQSCRYSTSRYG